MNLSSKKIAVWGIGASGLSALKLLESHQAQVTIINQGSSELWKSKVEKFSCVKACVSEEQALGLGFDFCVVSPGIAPTHKLFEEFSANLIPMISEVELALNFLKAPVMAITGTNGKTTSVMMLDHLLRSKGKKVFCGGNIGTPVCEAVGGDYDLLLLELSSFQLEITPSLKPKWAAILNISLNHQERYKSFRDYQKAKELIFANMDSADKLFLPLDLQVDSLAKVIRVNPIKENLLLPGSHNLMNFSFAFKMANELIKISPEQGLKIMESFKLAEHRNERIDYHGRIFINDSKSTNVEATLGALSIIGNEPAQLILGGQIRSENTDLSKLKHVGENIKLYAIGQAREFLAKELRCEEIFETLEECLLYIKKSNSQMAVLFSPGFPSFDQYKNYAQRGEDFKNLIKKIF